MSAIRRINPHTSLGPTIGSKSGHYFNLIEPETSLITIVDIVSGLAKRCRFADQCDELSAMEACA